MTVGRVQLPDGPIYVPEDSEETIQTPEWGSPLSIVDGSLNPLPLSDLDQVYLIEMFTGTSKYQVGSGSMCILLALLLCRVFQKWHGGFHYNVHTVRTRCLRSAKPWPLRHSWSFIKGGRSSYPRQNLRVEVVLLQDKGGDLTQ